MAFVMSPLSTQSPYFPCASNSRTLYATDYTMPKLISSNFAPSLPDHTRPALANYNLSYLTSTLQNSYEAALSSSAPASSWNRPYIVSLFRPDAVKPYNCRHVNCPVRAFHSIGKYSRSDWDLPPCIAVLESRFRRPEGGLGFEEFMILQGFYEAHATPLEDECDGDWFANREEESWDSVKEDEVAKESEELSSASGELWETGREGSEESDEKLGAEEEKFERKEEESESEVFQRLLREKIDSLVEGRLARRADTERSRELLSLLRG